MRIIKIFLITVVTLFILIIGLILGYQIRKDMREKKRRQRVINRNNKRSKIRI